MIAKSGDTTVHRDTMTVKKTMMSDDATIRQVAVTARGAFRWIRNIAAAVVTRISTGRPARIETEAKSIAAGIARSH
jgi:hypothetical protein